MAEPSGKPRRWFQFHLSTAIVLMLVASALVSANVVNRIVGVSFYDHSFRWFAHGWPISFLETMGNGEVDQIFWHALVVDLATAIYILFVAAFICEWIARRKRHGF